MEKVTKHEISKIMSQANNVLEEKKQDLKSKRNFTDAQKKKVTPRGDVPKGKIDYLKVILLIQNMRIKRTERAKSMDFKLEKGSKGETLIMKANRFETIAKQKEMLSKHVASVKKNEVMEEAGIHYLAAIKAKLNYLTQELESQA